MKNARLAADWNQERVDRVLQHYESQSEEDAIAEDENALAESGQTFMEVPSELVPQIRELIAKHSHKPAS